MERLAKIGTVIGIIAGALGIYVFINDEMRARFFPNLTPATKADVEEQMRLSEERIVSVVQSSVASAMASAEARGDNVSETEQGNFEAALTSLLASDDPTLNDAKFLAVSGQTDAAARTLFDMAELPSTAADPIPEKDRAELLRSAGDILVPSDPEKALAAYRKALELDPDNAILATRVQQLAAATAKQNAAPVIANAQFEYDGLLFEFEGCETDETLKCILSVTNSTPDTVSLYVEQAWAMGEFSRWNRGRQRTIRATNGGGWNVPSLEASQIEIGFDRSANVLQYLSLNLKVNNVSYQKVFRDLPVRGGRDVEVRQLRPIDPAHPERAFVISDVQFHFLGCSNPDAPICRIDVTNTGRDNIRVGAKTSYAYDENSEVQSSVQPDMDAENSSSTTIPPGVTSGWTVNFRRPADYLQLFELQFSVDDQNHYRLFRDMPLTSGPLPAIKSLDLDAAATPDGVYEAHGIQFVFTGCSNPDAPRCVTDIRNTTDEYLNVRVSRATGMVNGEEISSSRLSMEAHGNSYGNLPPGLTTSLINEFRTPVAQFDSLQLAYSVEGQSAGKTLESIVVE